MTIGIDESGRGPWAGPMVVCAVGLPVDVKLEDLRDSKRLNPQTRNRLAVNVKQQAEYIAVAWLDAFLIDEIGLSEAMRRGIRQVLAGMKENAASRIIIDGNINYAPELGATNLIKADAKIPAVSAASIIAKVARDNYMQRMALRYERYGFDRHKGYGTLAHHRILEQYGPSLLHRRSFAPIRKLIA